jgi:hypothetical protein
MVVYSCNPSTQEAKAGKSQVQGQPLLSETLSQKNKTKSKITFLDSDGSSKLNIQLEIKPKG